MADHDTWPNAPTQRPEPSWARVIATTVRLWVDRHPIAGMKMTGWRLVSLVAGAVIVVSAAVTGIVLGSETTTSAVLHSQNTGSQTAHNSPTSPSSISLQAATATRESAARWVVAQVGPSAIVACDPAMCSALQTSGLAASRLLMLGTSAPDPLGSDLVVATPAVRSQFGARLANVYAPEVIASFGSGAGRIDIRAVAPDGTAAYKSALAADLSARTAAGRQLIGNRHVSMPAAAKAMLRAGQVDPRLLGVIVALSDQQPLRILSFGDSSPGAGAAVPLRGAQIAPAHAGTHAAARLRAMLSFLQAQRVPYLPMRAVLVNKSALSVAYAAPSPLGLLSGT
jgi:hypothetical protein